MHNLIAGESVSRISRHALPQHWMPSAWNRTLSIGLNPAGVYSVFAKVTVCLQSGCIWPPVLASSWALKSQHTTPESTLLTIFSISFRRFVPFRVLSLAILSGKSSLVPRPPLTKKMKNSFFGKGGAWERG